MKTRSGGDFIVGALFNQAWQNECDGWVALGRATEAKGVCRVERTDSVTAAWWIGDPNDMDTYLHVHPGAPNDPGALLDSLEERVQTSAAKVHLRFTSADAPRWRPEAEARGYKLTGDMPLLASDLSRSPACAPSHGITVERVTADTYEEAFAVSHAVYNSPLPVDRFFVPQSPAIAVYLLRHEGTPACVASLWRFAGVAGIYSVATLPEFRGRGFATAVLNAVMNEAREEGFAHSILRTVDDLVPFYARSGFAVVGRVLNLTKQK